MPKAVIRSEPRRVAAMLLGAAMDDDAASAGLQRAAHDSQLAAVGGMMLSEIKLTTMTAATTRC